MHVLSLMLALAWAGSLQEIHDLEWHRAEPTSFAAHLEDPDPSTRARAAMALGRLHDPAAAPLLSAHLGDDNPGVQLAVAHAMAQTPGTATMIRRALTRLPAARTPADARLPHAQLRSALLSALGRQGDESDVETLSRALAEPWPVSGAAADGLMRLARRGLSTANARAPLVDALWRPDPRTRVAAAHALRRGGLESADLGLLEQVAQAAGELPQAEARAQLVTAVMPILQGEAKVDAFIQAASDPSPAVAVAALQGVEDSTVPPGILDTWLVHDDPWLRSAAIQALGRWGDTEALQAKC